MQRGKVTLAGAGVSCMAASVENIKYILGLMTFQTIGPNKVNELMHVRFLKDAANTHAHMKKHAAFMKPKIIEQSVLAVYFDKDGNVERLAHYTLKDGKVFDMISRVTPTGGAELTFLGQLLKGGANPGSMIQNALGGRD